MENGGESEMKGKMILIINICKEKLHYFEFVKPVLDILEKNKISYFTKHYFDLKNDDLNKADKVIICGTSLFDNEFVKDINRFLWLKDFEKPVFGICGGMQIIGLVFGGELKRKAEIGFYCGDFKKEFFGVSREQEVYHLHNFYVDFSKLNDFEIYSENKVIQAVKHRDKEIYGVLFHPEVRQKSLIRNFCLNNYDTENIKSFV